MSLEPNLVIKSESEAICRLCARQKDDCTIDLFINSNLDLLQKIRELLNVKIKPNDKVHNICASCNEKLQICHEFYEAVHTAQRQLLEIAAKTIKQEEVPVECDVKVEDEPPEIESHLFEEENHESSVSSSDFEDENDDFTSSKDKFQSDQLNKFYKFVCHQCSVTFPTSLTYQQHMRKSHQNENPTISCCNLTISCQRGKLLEHFLMHTSPEELQCRICSKQYSNKRAKRRHEKTHSQKRKRGPRLQCPKCDRFLADKATLQSHIKNVHTPDEERQKYECHHCGKKLTTKFSVLNHLVVKHGMQAETPVSNNEEILCPFCAKCFKNRSTYNYHYQVKHNIVTTVCPECGIEMNKKSLRSHMRRTHDYQPQNCPICMKQFRNMHAVLLHKNRVHVEPRHECDICGKMFKMKDKLKEHRKGHIIENRFQCDMCNVANNDYANILKHRKQVHPTATPIPHGMGKKLLEIGYQQIVTI
ncbi:zinc finger protein 154-like [Culicoides brevitarsis]|uniref:zinc finger protein 154-like n=1 Tax=Culicoides brevitarsis TaxID=469753 RepID=UPI00307BF983